MTLSQIHVTKSDLGTAALVEAPLASLAEGAVRFKVESFSVTSNNITYAVAGESFGYWNFFPAPDDQGIVPMWGHAIAVASNHAEIPVGERVYGYLPMATHLDVIPGHVSAGGFVDMAEHRQPMSPVYNQYSRLNADPEHNASRENERMIYGPLFKTGFILDYFMRSEEWFGASQLVLTSASSKTAMGMACVAKQNSPQIKRIGLTSSGNVDFVKATGLYDDVVAYDDLASIACEPSVSVDMAGNASVLAQIHQHFGDALKYSCLVGATHVDARAGGIGGGAELPGPQPAMFFAPDHFVAFFKQHGSAEGGQMIAATWQAFLDTVSGTVEMDVRSGIDAARLTYLQMISGDVDPAKGIVVKP